MTTSGPDVMLYVDTYAFMKLLVDEDELGSVVTYDARLAMAVADMGVTVAAPGLPERWWESPPSPRA